MSDINEVRERLELAFAINGTGQAKRDVAALLADHARLQAKLGKLQTMQARMRDPERQMVCDIIANGLDRETAGVGRYEVPDAQPAPAIDLEQFRERIADVLQDEFDLEAADPEHPSHDDGRDEALRISDRLLALINGRASPHPEGTPMMPAGRFYDGGWRLAPEGVRHHARMLTQSWRAADSSELKRALEAGVLALVGGQKAAPRGPDQPDLCDLCRIREEVRSDAEGIPFCQECWDGWQSEEAKQQPTKGEGA